MRKRGNVSGHRLSRIIHDQAAELDHVALYWTGQLDRGPVAPNDLAQRGAKLLQRLPERCPRLVLGGLAPKQAGQLLAGMGSRLQGQIGEKGQGLGPRRGGEGPPFRGEDRWRTEEAQDHAGHGRLVREILQRTGDSRKGKGRIHDPFTAGRQIITRLPAVPIQIHIRTGMVRCFHGLFTVAGEISGTPIEK